MVRWRANQAGAEGESASVSACAIVYFCAQSRHGRDEIVAAMCLCVCVCACACALRCSSCCCPFCLSGVRGTGLRCVISRIEHRVGLLRRVGDTCHGCSSYIVVRGDQDTCPPVEPLLAELPAPAC